MQVTVIPSDNIIIKDGEALLFSFDSPADMHALQWADNTGHIEFTGHSQPNHPLTPDDFTEQVQPFVDLWQAEQARLQAELEAEAQRLPSLEEAKANALAQLKEKRKAVEYGGCMVDGQLWDSELKDELRINSMLTLFSATGLESFEGWKVSEGVYITVTLPLLMQAAAAFAQHYAAAFAVEAAKIAEIEALDSPSAVQDWLASSLDTGWASPMLEGSEVGE